MIGPIGEALRPTFEFVTPIPYTELQKMLDESAPWGVLAYEKALYLDELSDEAIDVIADHMPQKASPMTLVPVFPMGGAYADVPDADTAFGGRRSAKFVFNISAAAPDQVLLDADRKWVRAFYDALAPSRQWQCHLCEFPVGAGRRPRSRPHTGPINTTASPG